MLEKFPALSLDWNYIIQRAKEEGVTGLIYRSLRKLALHMYLPEEDLAVLEKGYYVNSARNAIIFRQAGKILKAVCAHEIKVVMLKGVFLAEKVYLDIGLRPMSDIDVLVKKEDVSRVNDVLNSLGYFSADYQGFSPDLPAMSINTLVYKTPELLCAPVHLHWHIINSTWPVDSLVRGIDMESIWQRAQPVIIEGENVYTLSPEHLVIYLAQHCLMHKFRPMTLFSDLTGALGYYNKSLDREFMLKEAERFDLKEILFCCLYFMRKKFAYEPPEVKEIDFGDMDFFRKLCNFFIAQDGDYYRLSYLVFLSKQKGIARKFKFLIKTFFPSARVITHNSGILPQQVNLPFYVKRICAHLFKSRMKS
ncbi:MAG: nucleotidyltransferase family protein [Candidatus Omnitrophica bacterium]|nr:nucleotidyltransferase family protein [Candidatus Omnitrophota bacterium]